MSINYLSAHSFHVSAVYAKCTTMARRSLWGAMEDVKNSVNGPWMLVGDFNTIATVEERSGGSAPNARNMEVFNDAIARCGVFLLEFDGPAFTWTNGTLWQRLDRALVNEVWCDLFGLSKVSHLSRGRSDHTPLLVKCGSVALSGASFKFLNVWKSYPQFLEVVKEA